MKKLKGFLSLIRIQNVLILACIQALVSYRFILHNNLLETTILIIGTSFIVAGGNIINDYYDLEIDKINKPHKTLFTDFFSSFSFLSIYTILNLAAILLASITSFNLMLFFIGVILALWLYSFFFKQKILIGNFIVAILSGLSLLSVGIYYHQYDHILWLFSLFSFLMTLVRELIKDVEDVEGDQQGGCTTFPIVYGITKSKLLLYVYLLLINILLIYFLINQPFEWRFSIWGLVIIVLSIVLTLFISKAEEYKDFAKISSFCKKMMIVGTFGIIFT